MRTEEENDWYYRGYRDKEYQDEDLQRENEALNQELGEMQHKLDEMQNSYDQHLVQDEIKSNNFILKQDSYQQSYFKAHNKLQVSKQDLAQYLNYINQHKDDYILKDPNTIFDLKKLTAAQFPSYEYNNFLENNNDKTPLQIMSEMNDSQNTLPMKDKIVEISRLDLEHYQYFEQAGLTGLNDANVFNNVQNKFLQDTNSLKKVYYEDPQRCNNLLYFELGRKNFIKLNKPDKAELARIDNLRNTNPVQWACDITMAACDMRTKAAIFANEVNHKKSANIFMLYRSYNLFDDVQQVLGWKDYAKKCDKLLGQYYDKNLVDMGKNMSHEYLRFLDQYNSKGELKNWNKYAGEIALYNPQGKLMQYPLQIDNNKKIRENAITYITHFNHDQRNFEMQENLWNKHKQILLDELNEHNKYLNYEYSKGYDQAVQNGNIKQFDENWATSHNDNQKALYVFHPEVESNNLKPKIKNRVGKIIKNVFNKKEDTDNFEF